MRRRISLWLVTMLFIITYRKIVRVMYSPVYTVQFAYIVQDSADECSQDLHHKGNTRRQMAVLSKLQITEEQAALRDTVVALKFVSERNGEELRKDMSNIRRA